MLSLKTTLLYAFLILSLFCSAQENGYEISFRVNGLKEGSKCILANYYGGSQYIQDSAFVTNGKTVFKGKEPLAQGVYIFLPEGRPYFDFIVDKTQHFSLKTDTADYIKNMKTEGSEENLLFYQYQKFVQSKQADTKLLQSAKSSANKDSVARAEKKLKEIDEQIKKYRADLVAAHPKTFVAKLLLLLTEPKIPEIPVLPNGRKDSTFEGRYYKQHFFDNIDFSDERLLYTPVFHSKIKYYLDKLTIQEVDPPDSLNAAVKLILDKAKANKEVFKYLLNWMTYTYESSKVMGMEAVFVFIVENYHMKDQAQHLDSTRLYKITDKARMLKFTLLGTPAYPFSMKDTTGKTVALYDIKAKYTILVFWDYDCGHCKKEIPDLAKHYREKLKALGVEVIAVESEQPDPKWKKFIREHDLNWINVGETDDYQRAVIKKVYDIYVTPTMYLLDGNKRIRAKRISVEQLEGFIEHLEKKKKVIR
jgi:peroxiredoxin